MKVYVLWGFLGSGKTTLINHLLLTHLKDKNVVIIENESGKESIDGIELQNQHYSVVDLKSGCVCCTLRLKLAEVLEEIKQSLKPDWVLMEPSGLASLEDLLQIPGLCIDGTITLLDVKMYDFMMKLNPDFYRRQFYLSSVLFLTKTKSISSEEVKQIVDKLLSIQPQLQIIEDYRLLDEAEWKTIWEKSSLQKRVFLPFTSKAAPPLFSTETIVLESPIDRLFFKTEFSRINTLFGNQIIRAKGLLQQQDGTWSRFDVTRSDYSEKTIPDLEREEKSTISVWWKDKEDISPLGWISPFLNAEEQRCTIDDLIISDEELFLYMGFKGSTPDAYTYEIIQTLKKEALGICRPRLGYRFLTGRKLDRQHLLIGDRVFKPDYTITKYLQEADIYAIMVASVGAELDAWIQEKRLANDIMEAFIADALGSLIVEAIVSYGLASLTEKMKFNQLKTSNSYSPGYCGWNVREQQLLFSLLPQVFCGISLTDSSLMLPIKSVSSLIGIGRNIEKKPYGCSICQRKECFKKKEVL